MADRMLFITWRAPVRGREVRALEVFNDAMGLLGRMQQEGRVESFDVALLAPNGELDGYVVVHGSVEQIDAVRQDAEFLRNTTEALTCVDGLRHIEGYTNEGVARLMEMYSEVVAAIPQ